jgi:GcrA cell cycle regulator
LIVWLTQLLTRTKSFQAPGESVNSCSAVAVLAPPRKVWPISNPGVKEFCFCGNESVRGLPYCPGHARIAYPSVGRVGRQRSSEGA